VAEEPTEDDLIAVARAWLGEQGVDPGTRDALVFPDGEHRRVVFPPPSNSRAGDFTVIVDPASGTAVTGSIER